MALMEDDMMAREDATGSAQDSRTASPVVTSSISRSRTFAAMAQAMAKAQSAIGGAVKDKTNPHFKSAYADLASVVDACRAALTANEIAVFQAPTADGPRVTVTTLLAHKSGDWIESALTMTAQQHTPQGIGSCITYARRYALASMVGVAPEDDDGNAASQTPQSGPRAVSAPSAPEGFDDWLTDLEAVAIEGTEALQAMWKKSQPFMRKHLTDTQNDKWEALKVKAAKVRVSA